MAGDSNLGRDAEAVTGGFAYAADLLLRNYEQWREKIRLRYERFFRIRRSTSVNCPLCFESTGDPVLAVVQ